MAAWSMDDFNSKPQEGRTHRVGRWSVRGGGGRRAERGEEKLEPTRKEVSS